MMNFFQLFVLFSAHLSVASFAHEIKSQTHQDPANNLGFKVLELNKQQATVKFKSHATAAISNELIVRMNSSSTQPPVSDLYTAEKIPFSEWFYILKFQSVDSALENMSLLHHSKEFAYAQPNYQFEIDIRGEPESEPLFSEQWHLKNSGQRGGTPHEDIQVSTAWNKTTGDSSVLVAVLDGGFESLHPDLQEAWYVNPAEIPDNKMDDDQNGLVDDVSGWNFSTNSSNLRYGFSPSHGTATAGIIGARANGLGVTGICPQCKVLPVVFSKDLSTIIAAFYYAKQAGASVISNSWGFMIGTPRAKALEDTITDVATHSRSGKGASIIFATNNAGVNVCRGPEPDISAHPAVLAVSSSDHHGVKIDDSGYGPCLGLLAPSAKRQGVGIATTDRTGEKGYNTTHSENNFADTNYHNGFYGTSAAAPIVAGAAALIYSWNPNISSQEVSSLLLKHAKKINPEVAEYSEESGHSLHYGYGRIDLGFFSDL